MTEWLQLLAHSNQVLFTIRLADASPTKDRRDENEQHGIRPRVGMLVQDQIEQHFLRWSLDGDLQVLC
jgi:hypothetical protein